MEAIAAGLERLVHEKIQQMMDEMRHDKKQARKKGSRRKERKSAKDEPRPKQAKTATESNGSSCSTTKKSVRSTKSQVRVTVGSGSIMSDISTEATSIWVEP